MPGVTIAAGACLGLAAAITGLPWSVPLIIASVTLVGAGMDSFLTRRERQARRRAARRGGYLHG